MQRGLARRYEITTVAGETIRAFIPLSLSPDPPLEFTATRQRLLERATMALGRLDSVSLLLPDPDIFLYAYVRREAVLSSQIEGTQSSLAQLLLFELDEAPGALFEDVMEVSNYVAALTHGLERLQEGFPLSSRLIREMHAILLSRGRGSEKSPGEFRRSQNWIGGTRPGNAHFYWVCGTSTTEIGLRRVRLFGCDDGRQHRDARSSGRRCRLPSSSSTACCGNSDRPAT
jgi:Fic family protein